MDVDRILLSGKSTGSVLHKAVGGSFKLQVRKGSRGRGLHAACSFYKGEMIATASGHIESSENFSPSGRECLHWSKSEIFVMDRGTQDHLGVLANTAGGSGKNNARYICNRQNKRFVSLRATRRIPAGEEILAAYGQKYVATVLQQQDVLKSLLLDAVHAIDIAAPVVVAGGAVARLLCANCGSRVKANNRRTHARCCFGAINLQ
jgi:hypothetical protein